VSWRRHTHDDFAWEPAINLGGVLNTAANDGGPVYFEDDETRTTTLYFFSTRPEVAGGTNIFSSTLQPDGTWAAPVLVEPLSSPYVDSQPAISRDGREMYVSTNRPGSLSSTLDIWVSTRQSTWQSWSAPQNAGPVINLPTPYFQGRPSLSSDGTEMYFYAYRPEGLGAQDLYASTRSRIGRGPKH
jgi:hypothetical protein